MPISRSQTCTIIDGMAAVQSLANSSGAKTFGEWSDRFVRHVTSHFSDSSTRVDVLFDRYVKNSIKGGTRDMRKEKKNTEEYKKNTCLDAPAMWITEIRELETGKGSSF